MAGSHASESPAGLPREIRSRFPFDVAQLAPQRRRIAAFARDAGSGQIVRSHQDRNAPSPGVAAPFPHGAT